MNTFGENLKSFRNTRSLTQAELGDKVQLSRSQISNLETNFNEPDLASLIVSRHSSISLSIH